MLIRPWTKSDVSSLVLHGNNKGIFDNMTDAFPYPYTEKNAIEFIEMVSKSNPPSILAIEVNGVACGGIGIHPGSGIYRKNAELGYWLGESLWNQGIVSKCIPKMVHYGFSNWDIDRIYARPFGRNLASQKVLEKNNFTLETRLNGTLIKNEQIEDELIYAIRRDQM
ncbi:GNAT family N-acetyltransferase [bacterium]|nr:GNAT family N-acetyltransferase [bacterium]